ncbi:MAG: beta-galactosidase, partial [Microbacteriaceae bacterium]|nr:beta-galactosidase [Microbacteriaceae bacterium]
AEAVAARYAEHPAVAMWHVSNEYGPTSWGGASADAFRGWLQRKYGTLDALNEAWYTRFWSQTYTSWEQVAPPEIPRTWSNATRRLDFKRFASDVLLECFQLERDIIRRHSDLPITTNFMRFYKNADYWAWAPELDAVSLDIYPNPGEPDSRVAAALNFDLMRSLKDGPWILMEQAASSVSQWQVNNVKRPGMMRAGSYQAVAHGADTVLFFQWRASRGGHERFHSAMLPHSGTGARSWQEIEALGNELGRVAEVTGSTSAADVALVFDWSAWWGLMDTHGLPRNDWDYATLATQWYRPLLESHVAVDLAGFASDLSRYRVVVVPNAYLVTEAFAERLAAFAEAGGTVVIGMFSGVVNEDNEVMQPAYPGAFRSLIGAYVDEYWPAREGESFTVRLASGAAAAADWWQDSMTLESGSALAVYEGGLLDGRPAVVENRYGAGRVVYLGTRLEASAFAALIDGVVADAGVAPVVADAPAAVEATLRSKGGVDYLFLINHSEADAARVGLPRDGVDLLTGSPVSGSLSLAPLGVAVVRCG